MDEKYDEKCPKKYFTFPRSTRFEDGCVESLSCSEPGSAKLNVLWAKNFEQIAIKPRDFCRFVDKKLT